MLGAGLLNHGLCTDPERIHGVAAASGRNRTPHPPGRRYEEDFRSKRNHRPAYLLFTGENPTLRKITENSGGFARILDPERKLQKLLQDTARAAAKGSRGYRESYGCFCGVLDSA